MSSSRNERQLIEAKSAIQNGSIHRARVLLTELVKADKFNPEVWLWLSAVVETPKERRFCLEQVLKLDPQSRAARHGLAILGDEQYRQEVRIPFAQQKHDWEKEKGLQQTTSMKQIAQSGVWRPLAMAGIVLVAIAALILGGVGISRLLGPRESAFGVLQTSTPSATATAEPHQYVLFDLNNLNQQTPLANLAALTATPAPTRTPYVVLAYTQYEYNRSILKSLASGDWAGMIPDLTRLIEKEPQAIEAYYYLGEAYLHMGEYALAVEQYNQAIAIDPAFAPAYVGRAQILLSSEAVDFDAALNELELAEGYDDQLPEIFTTRAQIFMAQNNTNKAIAALNAARRLLPDDASISLQYASIYLQLEQYEKSYEYASLAQQQDANQLEAYLMMGESAFALEEYGQALEPLSIYAIYTSEPDASIWAKIGVCYLFLGDSEKAQSSFDTSAEIDPQNYLAAYYRGVYLLESGEFDQALEAMLQANKQEPKAFGVNLGIARARQGMDECNKSMYYFNRAEAFAADDSELASVFYYRAQCNQSLGFTTSAYRDWLALSKLDKSVMPSEWYQQALDGITLNKTETPKAEETKEESTATSEATATRTKTVTKTAVKTSTPTPTKTPTRTPTSTK